MPRMLGDEEIGQIGFPSDLLTHNLEKGSFKFRPLVPFLFGGAA